MLQHMIFQSGNELDDSTSSSTIRSVVHIRVQQRNGKKSITTIQGLANDLDKNKIIHALKKTLNTNGTVLQDEEYGDIIHLQGDQRKAVAEFLCTYHICQASEIKLHGF